MSQPNSPAAGPTSPGAITFPRHRVIGFVGARRIGDEDALAARVEAILAGLRRELAPGERLVALSAVAAGADTVFAEVAQRLGLRHLIYLPQTPDAFFNPADFGTDAALRRAQQCLAGPNVIEVHLASQSPDRRERFSECGDEIVRDCDILIAAFPPEAPGKPGGTLESLILARELGRRTIEVELTAEMLVRDTPPRAAASGRTGAEEDAVFGWPLRLGDAGGTMRWTEALKDYASLESRRAKLWLARSTVIVIGFHVLATAVATLALAASSHPKWLKPFEAGLLVAGLLLPAVLWWRRSHKRWVSGRLVAELCRSVLAARGASGRLSYLYDFHLPGFQHLIRSLNLLHLEQAGTRPMPPEFVADYLANRIGEPVTADGAGTRGQLAYYVRQAKSASRWNLCLRGAFFVCSSTALLAVGTAIWRHPPASPPLFWRGIWYSVVPVVFPTLAAACASLMAVFDLDRRIERYESMVGFLTEQREQLRLARRDGIRRRIVHRIERALLQEVVEWHAQHTHARHH